MANAYEHVFLTAATDVYYNIAGSDHKYESNAIVTEISSLGLKFVNTELIPPNTILDLKMILDKKAELVLVKARVLWQRQANSILLNVHTGKGYLHNTAVVFTNIASDDKRILDDYMHGFSQTVAINRAHLRWPLVLDAKFSIVDRPKSKDNDCVIGDIGIEGVKLFTKAKLDLNAKISLEFALSDAYGDFKLKGIVVRKVETKNSIWALGIEFSDIPIEDKEVILDFISSCLRK